MDKNTESINVRLPQKLYEELKKIADDNNINLSSVIRMALTEYLRENK